MRHDDSSFKIIISIIHDECGISGNFFQYASALFEGIFTEGVNHTVHYLFIAA